MSSATSAMALMPPCAITCYSLSMASSPCEPTDLACNCNNATFSHLVTACIMKSCSVRQQLITMNASSYVCGSEPAIDHSYIPPLIAFIVLAGLFVFMRFLARFIAGMKLWWDDYANLAAMLVCLAYTITGILLKRIGMGTDIWAVELDNITNQLKGFYAMSMAYVSARLLIRVSIILFYMRIFRFTVAKRVMLGTLISSGVISLSLILAAICMCRPISYFWLQWDGEHEGHCIDTKSFLWAGWIILLVNDFWIMAVPMPFVAKLQLSLPKKAMVSIMFSMGLVVVAISIYKLTLINSYLSKTNPTYEQVPMATWAGIEIDIGVICACLPSLPVLFRSFSSRLTSTLSGVTNTTNFTKSNSRYATISGKNSSKRGYISNETNMPESGEGNGDDHILMVSTIQQTVSRFESEADLPLDEHNAGVGKSRGGVLETHAWS